MELARGLISYEDRDGLLAQEIRKICNKHNLSLLDVETSESKTFGNITTLYFANYEDVDFIRKRLSEFQVLVSNELRDDY